MRRVLPLLLAALAVVPLPGQDPVASTPSVPKPPRPDFLLSRVDGRPWTVTLTGLVGKGQGRELLVERLGQPRRIPLQDLLALHGKAPRVSSKLAVYLVGGGELKGQLTGGDKGGYTFRLESRALGGVTIQVDRVRCMVFRALAPRAGPSAFQIPRGAKPKEAVFQKARRGFDTILGALERFTADGILFVPDRDDAPRLYRYGDLAGFALRGGRAPKKAGDVQLITTAGDMLQVDLLEANAERLVVMVEGTRFQIPLTRVAALTFLGGKRRYLSDLPILRVEERGSADDLGKDPLFPYRRDRTASGGFIGDRRSQADGFLTVAGRTYGKGLGVHSSSKLTFRVPKGCTRFHALVGIDDEVLALGVKGDADVRVKLRDAVLFTAKGLQRGQPPRSLGVLKVEPGALLTLEVGFGKGMFLGDRVDWLAAVFLP